MSQESCLIPYRARSLTGWVQNTTKLKTGAWLGFTEFGPGFCQLSGAVLSENFWCRLHKNLQLRTSPLHLYPKFIKNTVEAKVF